MASSWIPGSPSNFLPVDQGYNVRLPKTAPDLGGALINGANALLRMQDWINGLWIYKITANFELAGTMVQGPLSRDFYPHHLVAPKLAFSGQTPNNYERNRLSQFVRQSHITGVRDASDSAKESLQILVPESTWQQAVNPAGGHKGPHGKIDLLGYIDSMQFGADRFQTAHDYTFNFTISRVRGWLGLEDSLVAPTTWANFLNPPDINGVFHTQTVNYSNAVFGTKPGKNPAKKSISSPTTAAVKAIGDIFTPFTGALTSF